ncbi:MAG TPA: hypothetical protein ENK85_04050, partial [Saprospiraceae bacterium]|nr:hypothetical protein [Saprospiraceae bacterium]
MKHQKHTKLEKPFAGDFGRQEWAIIGTTCAHIQSLVQDISARLPDFKIAYLDASHAGEQDSSDLYLSYTRHHRVHEFRTRED